LSDVFGIIKQVMGFRQFSMREIEKAAGECTLVTLAWNVMRHAKKANVAALRHC
jgi:hypothetical protein